MGSLFIVLTYFVFKDNRTFGRKMLCILSAVDLVQSALFLLPEGDDTVCLLQSHLFSFFSTLSLVWTSCVALYAYLSVRGVQRIERFLPHFFAASVLVSAGMFGAALSVEAGWANLWCWIPDTTARQRGIRMLFYAVVWATWFSNLFLYLAIRSHIARLLSSGKVSATLRVDALRTVTYIPLILIVIRLPGSIHRVLQLLHQSTGGSGGTAALTSLQAFGDPSQGFADAVMFGFLNKALRERVWASLRTCRIAQNEESEAPSDVDAENDADGHLAALHGAAAPLRGAERSTDHTGLRGSSNGGLAGGEYYEREDSLVDIDRL